MCGGWGLLTKVEEVLNAYISWENNDPLVVVTPDAKRTMDMVWEKDRVEFINMCGAVWTMQKQKTLNYKFRQVTGVENEKTPIILIHREDREEINEDLLSHCQGIIDVSLHRGDDL